MTVAVVGCGGISELHLRGWAACGVRVALVVDVSLQRAKGTALCHGISRLSADWRDALAEGISIVDICTPAEYHPEIAIAALQANKHVVCEKPLATNLLDCDRIVKAERTSDGSCLVVHQLRFSEMGTVLRRCVDNGGLGRPVLGRVVRFDPPPANLVAMGRWGRWKNDGGGVLMTKALHQVDLLLWLLGPVRRVYGRMDTRVCAIESEDHLVATIEFRSKAMVSVVLSGVPWARRDDFELIGEKGRIRWPGEFESANGNKQALGVSAGAGKSRAKRIREKVMKLLWNRGEAGSQTNDHGRLFKAFLASIDGKQPVPVSVKDARAAVELCLAIYQSAVTGDVVELPLTEDSKYYSVITVEDYRGGKNGQV